MRGWRAPEGRLPHTATGVHVWLAVMPERWQGSDELLSPAERCRAARFVFDRDRAWFRFHHTALRMILAGYTGHDPDALPLSASPTGKPALEGTRWRFNLSHSGPVALCALAAERQVGVDVERLRPMPEAGRLAARFFAPAERESLERLEGTAQEAAFFACWTRKEAFVKATGEGFGRDLHSFTVPVEPRRRRPWHIEGGWTGLPLPAVDGCAGALVVEGDALPVHAWRFAA